MKKSLLSTLERPKSNFYIYGLFDPDTKELKYVGMSTTGFNRIANHYKSGYTSSSNVKKWIMELRKKGQIFDVQYFEYFDKDSKLIDEAEIKYIAYYKSLGCKLLNHQSGGRLITEEQIKYYKQTMSEKHKARWTPDSRKEMSEIVKKQWDDGERVFHNMKPNVTDQMREKCREHSKRFWTKVVDQYGNVYDNAKLAGEAIGVRKDRIYEVISGRRPHVHGYVFTKVSGGMKDKYKNTKKFEYKRTPPKCGEIYDIDGVVYSNAKDASEKLKIPYSRVLKILKGKSVMHRDIFLAFLKTL